MRSVSRRVNIWAEVFWYLRPYHNQTESKIISNLMAISQRRVAKLKQESNLPNRDPYREENQSYNDTIYMIEDAGEVYSTPMPRL